MSLRSLCKNHLPFTSYSNPTCLNNLGKKLSTFSGNTEILWKQNWLFLYHVKSRNNPLVRCLCNKKSLIMDLHVKKMFKVKNKKMVDILKAAACSSVVPHLCCTLINVVVNKWVSESYLHALTAIKCNCISSLLQTTSGALQQLLYFPCHHQLPIIKKIHCKRF